MNLLSLEPALVANRQDDDGYDSTTLVWLLFSRRVREREREILPCLSVVVYSSVTLASSLTA